MLFRSFQVQDILETYQRPDGRFEYSVPTGKAAQYPWRDLPVPPYVFAVWFAMTNISQTFMVKDKPVDKIRKVFRNYGFTFATKRNTSGRQSFNIRPSVRSSFLFADYPIPTTIPFEYIESAVEQRLELLEGFFDAGKVLYDNKQKRNTIRTQDYHHIRRFQSLIESLGLKSRLDFNKYNNMYTLFFSMDDYDHPVIGKERRLITSIKPIDPEPCVHIDTGTQILVGEGYIPIC